MHSDPPPNRPGAAWPCITLCFALCAALAGWSSPAHALDTGVRLAGYHRDTWTARHGVPHQISAMAQTPDGWLWLGSTTGLYRFDGVRFEAYAPPAGARLLGKIISTLAVGPDGALWIGYLHGGLSVVRNGRLEHIAPIPGHPVGTTYHIAFDADGSAWVASTTGLLQVRDGAWTRIGADRGYPAARSEYVYRDHYDRVLASDGEQLYLLDRVQGRFAPVGKAPGNALLLSSPDGRVWLSDGTTVRELPAPPGGWHPLPATGSHASAYQSLFDRDGNFWKGNCPIGLCRLPAGATKGPAFAAQSGTDRLDQPWQLSGLSVNATLEDNEGNIWVATSGGLERFRHDKLIRVDFGPAVSRTTLAADGAGGVWAVTDTMTDVKRLWKIVDGIAQPQATDQICYTVGPGKDGTVLVGGNRWIERRRGDRLLETYPLPPRRPGDPAANFTYFVADDGADLWVLITGRGLFRRHAGAWIGPEAHPHLRGALSATADARGRMWFGLRNNRLAMRDGAGWREFGARDGLAAGTVRFIAAGREVLVGGDDGLAVLHGDRFRTLAADAGDVLSGVSGIAVTADGDRWLNTSRGLLHVRLADWERSMLDPAVALRTTLWDTLDGYPGGAETIARAPTAFVSADGKLWVDGTEGAAWFDPARPHRNLLAPPVQVGSVTAGGHRYPATQAVALAPGTERLQIDYTALSYTMPERIRFRYRLLGADHDWQEVGTRRIAYYTNLAPGSYRFEVAAVNEDGVASDVARSAPIDIRPRFVQTRWFAALCALLALLALYLLYLLRLAQVKRRLQAHLVAQLGERERIARTLHDTFLQSLQNLILRLDVLARHVVPAGDASTQLARVTQLARQVMAEGRDRVQDLRMDVHARPLDAALEEAAAALDPGGAVAVAVRTEGQPAPLPAPLQDEVFQVAREALANALRHARAGRVDVTLDWRRGGLAVTVRDDGTGLDADVLAHGRAGHWGLAGMRERADRIGATLAMRNRTDGHGGAEVILRLPRRAWAAGRPGWLHRLRTDG